MTTLVGILNKRAAVIAADSAVTFFNQTKEIKTYNSANKIFRLSEYHPVGIMIYNSAEFMGTPWDIIIKLYRKQLGKKNFNTLKDFVFDFKLFLYNKNFFCDDNQQHKFLNEVIKCLYYDLRTNCEKLVKNNSFSYTSDIPNSVLIQTMKNQLETLNEYYEKNFATSQEFVSYKYESFISYVDNSSSPLFIKDSLLLDPEIKNLFFKYIYNVFIREQLTYNYTGLVFVGYGEQDIFPKIVSFDVTVGFDNRLCCKINSPKVWEISHRNKALILPFAQTQTIQTIIEGIDPNFRKNLEMVTDKAIDINQKKLLTEIQKKISEGLSFTNFNTSNDEQIRNIVQQVVERESNNLKLDEFKNSLLQYWKQNLNLYIQDKHLTGLYDSLEGMSYDEIAKLAESFINLTNLKKKMTSSMEDVGGPIDVAIISKDEGFIWIKQKHYFDENLNPHFFRKYNH